MKIKSGRLILGFLLMVFMAGVTTSAIANVGAAYLYSLSNFTGKIPYNTTRMSIDKKTGEIYVIYENLLRVFNPAGMEIYHFGEDLDVGQIIDVAVDPKGDLLLLAVKDSKEALVQCNYRGDPISKIDLKNLPAEFSGFIATRLVCHGDNLYFASTEGMKIVITDLEGNFKKGYDLFSLLELKEKERESVEVFGFSVDGNGNILFTIPVLFKAFMLSEAGKISYFGKAGGAPGKFNVVSGIVRDSQGNFLVVDRLKSAVMIFDKKHNFVTQFGFRGLKPENLFAPDDIAIDSQDRIYVTQQRKRGISVYKLIYT
jgi:hypothetical protein